MPEPFLNASGTVRGGWKALLFLLAWGAANAAAMMVLGLAPGLRGHRQLVPLQLLLFLATLPVSWLFLKAEGRPLASIGLRLDARWLREVLAGTLGGILLISATALVVYLAGGFHLVRAAGPGSGWPGLLQGAWLFLAVACNEEHGFRGYLFQRLESSLGPWATQVLLALLFALGHWGNPGMTGATRIWASLNIGLAAILLGLCYQKTRSLALPIGVHLGWNWAQGSLLGFGVSGNALTGFWSPVFHDRPTWLSGGGFGLEASLPCTLLCATACILVACWRPGKSYEQVICNPE